ncbi:MAG: flavin reductase family protein [Desulfobacterota bacterium]|nr:flavin reductase family protein [Thermodesulfobacteriota bacterium]MDW8001370.1 flavin reductase family protein [Deltaproteobacteria bacterium]
MNKKAFQKISYGVYIIASRKDSSLNGQIANTVFQVSSDPATFAVCINKNNLTHDFIDRSQVFSITVLSIHTPLEFIGRFGFRSGREINKFENLNFRVGLTGAPIVLDHGIAFIECRLEKKLEVMTHTIFVGKVENAEVLSDLEPLTYDYYHKIKGGKTAKNAPTFVKD